VGVGEPVSEEGLSLRDLLTHRQGFVNEAIAIRTADTNEFDDATIWRLLLEASQPTSRAFN